MAKDSLVRSLSEVSLFGGNSHPELTEAICKFIGITPGQMDVIMFGNNQRLPKLQESVRGTHTYFVQTTTQEHPEIDVIELFQMLDAALRASVEKVTLVLPYFPYVRSEKKDQPRVPITPSMIAGVLEWYFQITRVITLDLHAPAIQGFFHRIPCDELRAAPLFACALEGYEYDTHKLVATDAGADNNLGGKYRAAFGLKRASIQKVRDENTEKTKPIGLAGNVDRQKCILFDDEIATGGTLIGDAEFLLEHGAVEVSACLTHGVLAKDAPEKIAASPLKELWVTDTVPVPQEKIDRSGGKIRVVSCTPILGEAVLRTARRESLQPLLTTDFVRGLLLQHNIPKPG